MSPVIPTASAPQGKAFWHHLRAFNQDLIGYLAHLTDQAPLLHVPLGPIYIANHPDTVREVLVTKAKSFHKPQSIKRAVAGIVGTNVFASDGETWRVLRQALQPAFHMQRLDNYTTIMVDYTQEMLATWDAEDTVTFPDAAMDLTLAITTQALFSRDLRNQRMGDYMLEFFDLFNAKATAPITAPAWVPTPTNRRLRFLVDEVNAFLDPIIQERKTSGDDHGDLLSFLLEAQRQDTSGILTDAQVRNEVTDLFAAGYENVAHQLTFALYLIAKHPDVADKLYEEIDRVLGDKPITMATYKHLPYLGQVLDESLRLLPAATVLGRDAVEDVEIGGYTIPAGSSVLVAPWALHRREEFFPDPERFDPDRFAEERAQAIPKHAYIPFAAGPRVCLGSNFAMMQMRVNLATMLQQYRFSVPDDYEMVPVFRFNTRPRDPLPVRVQARASQPA
jgi:cytochrome P450